MGIAARHLGSRAALALWLGAGLALRPVAATAAARPEDDAAGGPPERRAEAAAKAAFFARFQRRLAVENSATSDYDATFYGLELDLDPAARRLVGTVTIGARAVVASLASAELDLDDSMRVDSVSVAGTAAAFTHSGGILAVTLDRSYGAGEPFEMAVHYRGLPNPAAGSFFFDDHDGRPLVWTLSEPYGARSWWPCKDTPADKADSVDVDLTVPTGMIAVSEGSLHGTSSPAPGKTTYSWRERYPIATYLVSIAAYAYVEQSVTYLPAAGGSMPVTVWSYPEEATAARNVADVTLAILRLDAGFFGEYPFVREKYGLARFAFGGGMEHQTATSCGTWGTGLAVHETAHQWFGDEVTCRDFSHVWLNEGFATYAEALWEESQGGPAAYRANIWDNRYYGPGTIWVPAPETTGFGRIFDTNLSYNKASWVLHMLRGVLGDSTFFRVLRTYPNDPRVTYGTATTEDFQAVAQEVSGRDLSRFFTNWIYRPYYPSYLYDFSSRANGAGWQVHLDIEQLQTHALYDMPVPVRVVTATGVEDRVVLDSLALQSFDLQVDAEPTDVQIDPDHWILCSTERAIHDPTFARGILVVNGVDWASPFGGEVAFSYTDSVFAGRYGFSFWDIFNAPPGGYVKYLPRPLGHGPLPPDLLRQFSTVVWVGNAFGGDVDGWNNASIISYLRQGGNVLLLARRGQEFLNPSRSSYMGLRWAESPVATLGGATPEHPDMVPMSTLGAQTQCAVFETGFTVPETELLLSDATNFGQPRGIAAWRRPAAGGAARPTGGNFAFVSGRPYRWNHAALRANVQAILSKLFGEIQLPVFATLEASEEAEGIRLGWQLADPGQVRALSLQRSEAGGPARTLASWSEVDSHGGWLDRDVRSGEAYEYRLIGDLGRGAVLLASLDVVRGGVPPARTRLFPIAPNPFNPGVAVRYELARAGRVTLRIFDPRGRLVRALVDTDRPAGTGSCSWDGRDDTGREAPSGMYFVRLQAGPFTQAVKATLAR